MMQTQIRTEALKEIIDVLKATRLDAEEAAKLAEGRDMAQQFFYGKASAFSSIIELLETLGPQAETEAYENGYRRGGE